MEKKLLIIFVKNALLGKVKTRLAKSIGNEKALLVYEQLLALTEKAVESVLSQKRVYFSETLNEDKWDKCTKYVQKGCDLGQKMQFSIQKGINDGFEKIVLIGSDLPDISAEIIEQGFKGLDHNEVVFGPAEDGGYYLLGMKQMQPLIFKNKRWSTDLLLRQTIEELKANEVSFSLLEVMNDIDTEEDLKTSSLSL